jgi:hypothetical protein
MSTLRGLAAERFAQSRIDRALEPLEGFVHAVEPVVVVVVGCHGPGA